MKPPRYKRILLKLSGEALMGEQGYGIDHAVLDTITSEVKEVAGLGVDRQADRVRVRLDADVPVVACPGPPGAWNALVQTTWACWPPC